MNLRLGKEEVRRRTEQAMNYMELDAFAQRSPHYLSGGEKKRVSIADIVAMGSEIFLFDEPTASLDPKNTLLLEETLTRLNQDGSTILVSTHDLDFALRWADRILVFHRGQLIGDNTPEKIFSDRCPFNKGQPEGTPSVSGWAAIERNWSSSPCQQHSNMYRGITPAFEQDNNIKRRDAEDCIRLFGENTKLRPPHSAGALEHQSFF